MPKDKVMVGMSGGVDSSVAALLLKRQGYEVTGATFRLWPPEHAVTESPLHQDITADAQMVCEKIGISHHVFDFRELFRETVVAPFIAAYESGETPNPCICCNKSVKFGAFIDMAKSMGYDYVATGHYALIEYDGKNHRLRRGAHARKDQSYVLYTLTQTQLASALTPLGGYTKDAVRALSEENGLAVHGKAESQDICFVPSGDYAAFIRDFTGREMPGGDFINASGEKIGVHKGICHYTIGQRRGLGSSFGTRMFVSGINAVSNTVTLGNDASLWRKKLTLRDVNWIESPEASGATNLDVKIRYTQTASPAAVTPLDGKRAEVCFVQPQRAVTPGQAAVFYKGDYVVGGGTIDASVFL